MSKAQRKRDRAKRNQISLAGGETAPNPRGQGYRPPAEDPRKVVIAKRVADNAIANPQDALQPIYGTEVGCCIISLAKPAEVKALSDAWHDTCAAWETYCQRYLGRSPSTQSSSLAMVPDKMETDQSLRVDLRTSDEKDASAVKRQAEWAARINALPTPAHKWVLRNAIRGGLGEFALWRDGAITAKGKLVVDTLRMLCATS
ncbi:MAG: hypothetical protein ACOH2M_28240 [Cypionkella sp.]